MFFAQICCDDFATVFFLQQANTRFIYQQGNNYFYIFYSSKMYL